MAAVPGPAATAAAARAASTASDALPYAVQPKLEASASTATATAAIPASNGSASGQEQQQQQQSQQSPQHKRVYQACIPCRRRKVKCDLGSVDNPGDPPCVRCRRESKECFFSATRRKRKNDDGRNDSLDGFEYGDDYVVRNGRKMLQTSPPASVRQSSMGAPSRPAAPNNASAGAIQPPLTPGGSIGQLQPLRRPEQTAEVVDDIPPERAQERTRDRPDESNTQLDLEAQEVMRREVYGPHDALDLLYKAATNRYSLIIALRHLS